jgi:hypothetical protein
MAKFWKITYREWLNPEDDLFTVPEIGQIPAYNMPESARPRNIDYHDLVSPASQFAKSQRKFYVTSRLKPSSGDKRFRLVVVSRNFQIDFPGTENRK